MIFCGETSGSVPYFMLFFRLDHQIDAKGQKCKAGYLIHASHGTISLKVKRLAFPKYKKKLFEYEPPFAGKCFINQPLGPLL